MWVMCTIRVNRTHSFLMYAPQQPTTTMQKTQTLSACGSYTHVWDAFYLGELAL